MLKATKIKAMFTYDEDSDTIGWSQYYAHRTSSPTIKTLRNGYQVIRTMLGDFSVEKIKEVLGSNKTKVPNWS